MKENWSLAILLCSIHSSQALLLSHATRDWTGFGRSCNKKKTSSSRKPISKISKNDPMSRVCLWSTPHKMRSDAVASMEFADVAADDAAISISAAGIEVTEKHTDSASESMFQLEAQRLKLELELLSTRQKLNASCDAQAKLAQSAEAAAARFARRESLLTLELEAARFELAQSQELNVMKSSDTSMQTDKEESNFESQSRVEKLQAQLFELQQDRDRLQNRTELLALELLQARLEIDMLLNEVARDNTLKQGVEEAEGARDQAMARVNLLTALLQQKTALLEAAQCALDDQRDTRDDTSTATNDIVSIEAELAGALQMELAAETARASAVEEADRWKKRSDLALLSLQVG